MKGRGIYGTPQVAGDGSAHGSSWGAWVVGILAIGGAVLWAKHQSDQIEKLYTTTGLPYESFTKNLRLRAGELSSVTGEKFQGLAHRLGTRKELKDGT